MLSTIEGKNDNEYKIDRYLATGYSVCCCVAAGDNRDRSASRMYRMFMSGKSL
jgi:hypothetical protein